MLLSVMFGKYLLVWRVSLVSNVLVDLVGATLSLFLVSHWETMSRYVCACTVQTPTSLCVDDIVTSSAYDAMWMFGGGFWNVVHV